MGDIIKFWLSFSRRRKVLLGFLLALCVPGFLLAQGAAAEIEALLASDAVTYAQVARFALEAADVAALADPSEAFHFAMERGWLPGRAEPDGLARLDSVALLLMQSFGMGGGILFTLTGSAHFAYREMEHKGFIRGRASPSQMVSGETLLYLVGRALAQTELAHLGAGDEG